MSDVLYDLQVTHTSRSPVFVIGYARSGTSLTCRLLRRYFKVSFGTESQFIVRYQRRLARYGDLNDDGNLRRLIRDISAERFFARSQQNWGFVFDPAKALSDVRNRSYGGVLNAIFGQLAEHNGMVRWGDKTPQYNSDLGFLRRLFPDAQFIHIVRDGRDVALSFRKVHFGPKNAYATAKEWLSTLTAIRAFARELPSANFFEFRYEDLTERPAETLEALAHFLGIDDDKGDLRSFVRRHITSDVRAENSRKWLQALPAREIERFEAVAAPVLGKFGYELAYGHTACPVSAPERLYWILHNRALRFVIGGHWADNWYKLGLRARTLRPLAVRHTTELTSSGIGKRHQPVTPVMSRR